MFGLTPPEDRGHYRSMEWRKRIRFDAQGVSVAADINAAIAVNQGEPTATNEVVSVSHVRVVQDSRRHSEDPNGAEEPETGGPAPNNEQEDAND